MENLKLISVRIDPVTLQKIDDFCNSHYYWKRNTIINGLLSAVVDAMDNQALYDMVRYSRNYYSKPDGSFHLPDKLSV